MTEFEACHFCLANAIYQVGHWSKNALMVPRPEPRDTGRFDEQEARMWGHFHACGLVPAGPLEGWLARAGSWKVQADDALETVDAIQRCGMSLRVLAAGSSVPLCPVHLRNHDLDQRDLAFVSSQLQPLGIPVDTLSYDAVTSILYAKG